MTRFDEMLDKYGLPHELFGVSAAATPEAQDMTVAQGCPRTPAEQDGMPVPDAPGIIPGGVDNAVPVIEESAHDPSLPPWVQEREDNFPAIKLFLSDDDEEENSPG